MDKSTKAITLAATSKNLQTQQSRCIYSAVCKVKTRWLHFLLNVLRAMHRMFFHFFSNSLKINCIWPVWGRTKVRWRPGQERSSTLPFFKLRSFRSKCTHNIVETFRYPQWFGTPGICPPCYSPRPVASKYCWLLNQDLSFQSNYIKLVLQLYIFLYYTNSYSTNRRIS